MRHIRRTNGHLALSPSLLMVLAAFTCQVGLSGAAVGAIGITNLGILPGGVGSSGRAISADGSVVVGISYSNVTGQSKAFRWTASGGMTDLGTLGGTASAGLGLDRTGSIASGYSAVTSTSGSRPFRWSVSDNMQALPTLPGGNYSGAIGIAAAMSGDGSVVVGAGSTSSSTRRAIRWNAAGTAQDLGSLRPASNAQSAANAVSADGLTITGVSDVDGSALGHAFRWTTGSGMQLLGTVGVSSAGYATNANGSVIVGESGNFPTRNAFRWTSTLGMQDLGTLGGTQARALTVSAGGDWVAGWSYLSGDTQQHGFLWNETIGIVDMNSYLTGQGISLAGWTILGVSAISADGSTITGTGLLNGEERAFVISGLSVPVPASATVLAMMAFAGKPRRRRD